ncbi:hypothetical protein EXIGLDRAFT_721664 [Exidia glandulosa HHB12029]|uniref:Nudix hydrolase domain-containing protein n=1 Tax=Exidia glandulosa HHB12029 TaxID=1314781 RepID=A0A165QCH3_EXIGL|nr:hypothetical protein EXIGLDRAFT_721664 [Exidia glandulosa HHB12029]
MPRTSLLKFHKPALTSPLKDESRRCLRNLAQHRRGHIPPAPRSRSAAVLVALFVGRWGDLHVLLSRRADSLSSYAGDTALPGGKVEPRDRSLEDTARREAFEEIGLPRDKLRVPLLCTLEPFLARNKLVVTPVVVLITDQTLRPILNDSEVKTLFSHPLAAFLSEEPPYPLPATSSSPEDPLGHPERVHDPSSESSLISELTSEVNVETRDGLDAPRENEETPPYHTFRDIDGVGGSRMRMHSFLTGREGEGVKPVYGLTSAILIHTAQIGYARPAAFEVNAPGQNSNAERIAHAMRNDPILRDAAVKEGLGRIWGFEGSEGGAGRRRREKGKL